MAEKGFSEYFVDDGSDFSVEHGAILIVDMLNDFCKRAWRQLSRSRR